MGVGRDFVQPEEVTGCPTKSLGLLAPFNQKPLPILNRPEPAAIFDVIGAAFTQGGEYALKVLRVRPRRIF